MQIVSDEADFCTVLLGEFEIFHVGLVAAGKHKHDHCVILSNVLHPAEGHTFGVVEAEHVREHERQESAEGCCESPASA